MYLLGGIKVPLFFYWPEGIKTPIINNQLAYALDILPTVIDAAGIKPPDTIYAKRKKTIENLRHFRHAKLKALIYSIIISLLLTADASNKPHAWLVIFPVMLAGGVSNKLPKDSCSSSCR